MNDASIVQFYRGPKKVIDKIDTLEDGKLFFATDTRQIMMDCNFVDSLNNNYNKRITFGGSTGIVYGIRGAFEVGEDFRFKKTDLDNVDELPSINDLILNNDGCFYRVTQIFPATQEVGTERLTLQGSGGSGTGGGNFHKNWITDPFNSFFSINDTTMPISFGCQYEDGMEVLQIELSVNQHSIGSLGTLAKDQIKTVDIAAYKNYLNTNLSNEIKFKLTARDSEVYTYMTFNVFIHNIYITIDEDSKHPSAHEGNCPITVRPYGGLNSTTFTNRVLVYELRRDGDNQTTEPFDSWEYPTTADNNDKVTYPIPHQPHGIYTLTVYLKVGVKNSDINIISEKHFIQIPFRDPGVVVPLITVGKINSSYTQYDNVKIEYSIDYNSSTSSTSLLDLDIYIDRGIGKELLSSDSVIVDNNRQYGWNVSFNEVGIYYLSISLHDTEYFTSLQPITVSKYEISEDDGDTGNIPLIDTSDIELMLYLSAKNRNNNDLNKDYWRSNYSGNDITCQFEGFNWLTNGWLEDIQGDVALHLTNGAKLTIPYSPFTRNEGNQGAEGNGCVIELDFKLSNIRDLTQPGITCKSSYMNETSDGFVEKINTGIQIYGNKAQLFSLKNSPNFNDMSGRTAIFKENERIHLAYIINNSSDTPKRMIYTMLNGVVSSLAMYADDDQFVDQSKNNPSKFIFDSTHMDIDIYNVRVYSSSKTPNFVLKNHYADNESITAAVEKWRPNNVRNTISASDNPEDLEEKQTYVGIDLEKVKNTINIPYMIFEDGRQTSDKKDKGWENESADITYPVSSEARLPTDKKDYRHMTITYVDPQHPENNIPAGTVVTCYAQGTSSLEYPVKNLRIYFKKDPYKLFNNVPPVNLFTLKADYMESSSSHNTGTANALNKLYSDIGLDKQLPNREYLPATQNVLTAILGKPIVCFYRPYQYGCSPKYPYYYQYIGRYNFNYDKATHEIFGFESLEASETANNKPYGYLTEADGITLRGGFNTALEFDEDNERTYYRTPSLTASASEKVTIPADDEKSFEAAAALGPLYEYKDSKVTTVQCWEFLNNSAPLIGFRQTWDEEIDKVEVIEIEDGKPVVKHAPYQDWTSAFECRYPEHTDEASTDKRALARVVNWLASTNRDPKVIRQDLINQGRTPDTGMIQAESARRLEKFKKEFNDYFLKDFVTFYYIMTEFLVMMDSRGKNMMFACYDADPDNNVGHWLPIFYDMDTMLGLNNSGQIVYSYDVEDDNVNVFNLAATYESTQYSVLWCNFKEAFFGDIKTMYNKMRKVSGGSFNYGSFLKMYNENQGEAWKEIYLNEDADYKYIDPVVDGYTVWFDPEGNIITAEKAEKTEGSYSKTAENYLYAAQGSRALHRAYWLQRRFNYLDSKYDYAAGIGSPQSALNVRLSSEVQKASLPFNATYNLIPKYNQYVTLNYLNTSASGGTAGQVGPIRLFENVAKEITVPLGSAKEQESYYYGVENLKDMGLQADKYYQKFVIKKPLNVTKLEIGTFIKDWENTGLGSSDGLILSDPNNLSAFLPYLEYLNIQNCTAVEPTRSSVDMSLSPCLQELYAYGTKLTSISFFDGGNLRHLELPATTQYLILKGQLFFDTYTKRTDQEIEAIRKNYTEVIAQSIRQTLLKESASEEEIAEAIANIELTEIQREHLTLEGYDNLTTLRISNCPLLDSKTFIKKLLRTDDNGLNYRTNLQYFRMEDVNWIITKDECVIETTKDGKNQIQRIPLLDVLMPLNGINNSDQTIEHREAGNDYFAGTITIDNSDLSFGVNEYILYNKYERMYPNLKFKYTESIKDPSGNVIENTHNTKAYFIGINNDVNQPDPTYSKKISATEIGNINATLKEWFTPIKLENGSWDATHVPKMPKGDNSKYSYEFIGWSLEKTPSFDEDKYDTLEDQITEAKKKCKIIITEKEDKTYEAVIEEGYSITEESFGTDQELHFYPVYIGIIRTYPVYFYWKKNGKDELLGERQDIKYGHNAVPPVPPINIVLDEADKTKTTIYPFIGYDRSYTNIQGEVTAYARFGEPVDIKTLSGDMISTEYFERNDNDPIDLPPNSTGLYIKADFEGEALIVPKMWNGKLVRFIGTHSGEIPNNLKRIFFEKDNEVLAICDTLMSSQSQFEYIDFSALTKLTWIGPNAFQNCPNLYVPTLPDSITQIGNNAFYECPGVVIKKLPDNLESLGTSVFQNCIGLTSLNINNTKLKSISDSTFCGCSNLTIVGETIDCDIEEIGISAFEYCENLVLNFEDSGSLNPLKEFKFHAFGECNSLSLNNLPNQLEVIGNAAFIGKSGTNSVINVNTIPMHVKKLDIGAFMFRRLADKFNGLFIIENPDIDINEGALSNFSGVKYILVPASVDTTVAPWNNKLGASGAKYITSLDQMV